MYKNTRLLNMSLTYISSAHKQHASNTPIWATLSGNDYPESDKVVRFDDYKLSAGSDNPYKKAWKANISQHYRFKQSSQEQIQVNTKSSDAQFSTLIKMLKANTCACIFIDMVLNDEQKTTLSKLNGQHQTRIIHVKQALLCAKLSPMEESLQA